MMVAKPSPHPAHNVRDKKETDMNTPFQPQADDALIVIDVQNDFLPGNDAFPDGALMVPQGDAILPVVENLIRTFNTVVLTQDWHPADHMSFADNAGQAPFTLMDAPYGPQVLWPRHCVAGQPGSALRLSKDAQNKANLILRKGTNPEVDSYSAFLENDKTTATGLGGWLRERKVKRVVFVGLATDYCVGFSALDAQAMGFEAIVLLEGCRGIADDTVAQRLEDMKKAGVTIVGAN